MSAAPNLMSYRCGETIALTILGTGISKMSQRGYTCSPIGLSVSLAVCLLSCLPVCLSM